MRQALQAARVNGLLSWVRASCSSWLRVSTSSLTRVIRSSSTSTVTRMVWVVCGALVAGAPSAAGALASGAGGGEAGAATATGSGALATGAGSGVLAAAGAGSGARSAAAAAGAWLAAAAFRAAISSESSPAGSAPVSASAVTIALMRSIAARIRLTMAGVTASVLSRSLPSTFSPAWATCSSRGRPRKPQVPLMVCTRRKIPDSVSASSGVRSSVTSATSRVGQAFVGLGQEIGEQIVHCEPLCNPARRVGRNPWQHSTNKRLMTAKKFWVGAIFLQGASSPRAHRHGHDALRHHGESVAVADPSGYTPPP